ncbi:MAG: YicC/YloC family endoribonuclease [Alphaproteobacteria bacterium]
MSLSSMTGFARAQGEWNGAVWSWELRSVNGKGLDLRFRLPPGMDALDAQIRKLAAKQLTRGNVSGTLTLEQTSAGSLSVNEDALAALVKAARKASKAYGLKKPRVEALMGLKGVLTTEGAALDADQLAEREAALAEGFGRALDDLDVMRVAEGAQLSEMLVASLNQIAEMVQKARTCDAAMPTAIHNRLKEQITALLEAAAATGETDRIAQEAAYLAVKADVREELDRLDAHIDAALALIAGGSPAGRKLDFLAQEFAREANTLCSKAGDQELSRIGLDLKAVVDQMREQIQNVE